MKSVILAIVIAGVIGLGVVPPAQAGSSTDAALALGAFAVFNQLVRGETIFGGAAPQPAPVTVYAPPPPPPAVVYAPPPPVVYAPPPATVFYAPPPVVVHGHGRWMSHEGRRVGWGPPAHLRHGWRHYD